MFEPFEHRTPTWVALPPFRHPFELDAQRCLGNSRAIDSLFGTEKAVLFENDLIGVRIGNHRPRTIRGRAETREPDQQFNG